MAAGTLLAVWALTAIWAKPFAWEAAGRWLAGIALALVGTYMVTAKHTWPRWPTHTG